MNKINSIKISGIRGIKHSLELNLNQKSILSMATMAQGKVLLRMLLNGFIMTK